MNCSEKLPTEVCSLIHKDLCHRFPGERFDYVRNNVNDYSAFWHTGKNWIVLLCEEIIVVNCASLQITDRIDLSHHYTGHFREIHSYQNDYLLYEELYILRLDRDFNVIWEFSARDILVRADDQPAFQMGNDRIVVDDWLGWRYNLNYDGLCFLEEKYE